MIRAILDCDPGHDDAVALAVACRHLDLAGVTTVGGNAGLTQTTRNAVVVLDLLGRADIAVHAGADHPLLQPLHTAAFIHGESGLAGADLPEPSRPATSHDAVGFIVDTVRAEEGLWLVVTGPMTNVALAMRAAPDLSSRIAGVSFMGGGTTFGNRTPVAEFNIWCDPEAAAIVVDSAVPLIMTGLNVTHHFQASPARIERLRANANRASDLFADLLTEFSRNYQQIWAGFEGAAVHDPLAVLVLTHPELFVVHPGHLAIETAGRFTRGMTVVDQRALIAKEAPNAQIVADVDADAAFDVIVACLAGGEEHGS
jgi:inosine-uridine nucleoside N-ribohydrolase